MEIQGKNFLILGGAGQVGKAVSRRLLAFHPAHLVIASIDQASAEATAAMLAKEAPDGVQVSACWGNIFVPWEFKDMRWDELLADGAMRRRLLDDLLDPMVGERKEAILENNTLARFVRQYEPDGIIDCINTATAFAYQNIYASSRELLETMQNPDPASHLAMAEKHVLRTYIPHLVRHIQILNEVLKFEGAHWRGVRIYIKVGTSGTGGMGLNIPYTHGEEKPSAMLLSKSALAGGHSMLMFLLARTPPTRKVVKEIKPTAAIGWAQIGYGPIRRRGRPIELYDCPPEEAYPLDEALADEGAFGQPTGGVLENVYVDTGENGLFALQEFSTITSLNQMEFVTPEEIAHYIIMEIQGGNTGFDIISALDQSVLGPTYRAGILREGALARMRHLEREHDVESIAFEILGPPRLSKLLYEAYLLKLVTGDSMTRALTMSPEELAEAAYERIAADARLRSHIISIGIPILTPDGEKLLRGPEIKGEHAEDGWVDLTPENMAHWQERIRRIRTSTEQQLQADRGQYSSRYYRVFVDPATGDVKDHVVPGDLAGWIFTYEEGGIRVKS
ncbi:MAG TPA: short-chain dehydrogenase [Anaerolineae bacterium]|nr:short-chain dehydrogenase [Caldilineae bacterium]HID35556.1 short-chain dehydrogenase [Anaerolineae bacterium]HIQ11613.1 short-chain dehydrogenase [Caldilineales bacterium]